MTIAIQVSVNGDYEVPVTTKYGTGAACTKVLSGVGSAVPVVAHIPYYHGNADSDVVVVTVGPEKYVGG